MKITEKMLLDGYDGVCNGGTLTSMVNNEQIWWDYRIERDDCDPVTTRDRASHILLSNGRTGSIDLDNDCDDHPALTKIAEDEAKLYGNQI